MIVGKKNHNSLNFFNFFFQPKIIFLKLFSDEMNFLFSPCCQKQFINTFSINLRWILWNIEFIQNISLSGDKDVYLWVFCKRFVIAIFCVKIVPRNLFTEKQNFMYHICSHHLCWWIFFAPLTYGRFRKKHIF